MDYKWLWLDLEDMEIRAVSKALSLRALGLHSTAERYTDFIRECREFRLTIEERWLANG